MWRQGIKDNRYACTSGCKGAFANALRGSKALAVRCVYLYAKTGIQGVEDGARFDVHFDSTIKPQEFIAGARNPGWRLKISGGVFVFRKTLRRHAGR